jgi:spermidine synthase
VLAGALVFLTAGSVLVLEILAARLLAPYVGVTLETYTAIIGVVLAGISVGTWAGGRLADAREPRSTLGPLVAAGGLLALAALPAVRFLGALSLGGEPTAVVLLAGLCFFPAAAVLSAVAPTVVKLQLGSLGHTGRVVGRLSALGTAGAIFGTFVTGFVLVSALPTTPIVVGLGVALVIVGALLAVALRRGSIAATVVATIGAIALSYLGTSLPGPCDTESAYFCARVERDAARPSGRVLQLDTLSHSYVDLEDPGYLGFEYTRLVADVAATVRPAGAPIDALHIGGGGFTMPRYLAAMRPRSRSLVLELDPALVRLARERLGLVTGPDLAVRTGDARLGVRELPGRRFDLVVGDAFGGLAVPWHLATREFAEQIERTLRPDGVYVLNAIDYPPLGFVKAEAATLGRAFRHVALLAPPERVRGEEGGNFVLVASNRPLALEVIRRRIADRLDTDAVVAGPEYANFAAGAPELTDEYAPVDQLLTPLP